MVAERLGLAATVAQSEEYVAGILRYQGPAASFRSVNQGPESGAVPAAAGCAVGVGVAAGVVVGSAAAVAAADGGVVAAGQTPLGSSPPRICHSWGPVLVAWKSCLAG